jgi:hypothetical protein
VALVSPRSRRRSSTLLTGLLLLCLVAPAAAQDKPRDALVVLATGDVSGELAEDVTEAISFSIAKDKGMNFLPKEAITAKLGYVSPAEPGDCLFDNQCLRRIHKELKTRYFIAARLQRSGGGYKITVVRVAHAASGDVVEAAAVPDSASDVINKTRALVVASLKVPMATFVFSVNETDAIIELGGKKVGTGNTSVRVKPGTYSVKVSKPGFQSFQAKLRCDARRQCIVPVNLIPKRVDPGPGPGPGKTEPSNTPMILQATGWSAAGVGAAMTVVGVVFGLQASDAQSQLEAACPIAGQPCSIDRAAAQGLQDDGDQGSSLFNAVGIPGMILLGGGLITAIVGHVIDTPAAEGEGKVDILPTWIPNAGLGVNATFRF